MKIIAFTGAAGVGKDTAADIVHGWFPNAIRYSFAAPLRSGLAAMFGTAVFEQSLDTSTKDSESTAYGVTCRKLLQSLGTDWGRDMINPDIWVIRAEELWAQYYDSDLVIISDLRFDNEADLVHDKGGIVVGIRSQTAKLRPEKFREGKHASEFGISEDKLDCEVINYKMEKPDFIRLEQCLKDSVAITEYLGLNSSK